MNVGQPIVVDLGKVRRKHAKALRSGQGKLVGEIQETLNQVREGLGQSVAGKRLFPVVILYKKKGGKSGFPFPTLMGNS